MKKILLRPAIAMIELIFAIVVMGIAMLSIPLMLESATKSSLVAFQQESIAIIASHANSMMTYAWDENNTVIHTPNNLLTVNTGDLELDGNSTLNQSNQIRTLSANSSAHPISSFGFKKDNTPLHNEVIFDDIDDFDKNTTMLSIAEEGTQLTTKGDYMDIDIAIATDITYLNDTAIYSACSTSGGCAFSKTNTQWGAMPTTQTTNIKLITTVLTSSNVNQRRILLRSFMCNIGAVQPVIRNGI